MSPKGPFDGRLGGDTDVRQLVALHHGRAIQKGASPQQAAKRQQSLRSFRDDATRAGGVFQRDAGMTARRMLADRQGETIADEARRIGGECIDDHLVMAVVQAQVRSIATKTEADADIAAQFGTVLERIFRGIRDQTVQKQEFDGLVSAPQFDAVLARAEERVDIGEPGVEAIHRRSKIAALELKLGAGAEAAIAIIGAEGLSEQQHAWRDRQEDPERENSLAAAIPRRVFERSVVDHGESCADRCPPPAGQHLAAEQTRPATRPTRYRKCKSGTATGRYGPWHADRPAPHSLPAGRKRR